MSIWEVEFKQAGFHEIVVCLELSTLDPGEGKVYRSPLPAHVAAADEKERRRGHDQHGSSRYYISLNTHL